MLLELKRIPIMENVNTATDIEWPPDNGFMDTVKTKTNYVDNFVTSR